MNGYTNKTVEKLRRTEALLGSLTSTFDRKLKKRDLSLAEEARLIATFLEYVQDLRYEMTARYCDVVEQIKQ
jgi:hypothetical protein